MGIQAIYDELDKLLKREKEREAKAAADPVERIITLLTGIDYKLNLLVGTTAGLSRTFVD